MVAVCEGVTMFNGVEYVKIVFVVAIRILLDMLKWSSVTVQMVITNGIRISAVLMAVFSDLIFLLSYGHLTEGIHICIEFSLHWNCWF